MAIAVGIGAVSMLIVARAEKVALSTYAQGAPFEKCISIADFEGKTLADEIDLVDMVGGCCPSGSVPGAKWYTSYKGAQIVCGFKDDGSVSITTGSSNGAKTCTYNKCYVDKQNLPCADDTKQLLNGCCKGTTQANQGFKSDCKNYYSSFNNVFGEKVNYCTTYDKDYGSKGWKGTSDKTDDQADGKLVPSKIYTYTPCGGGDAGGDATPAPTPAGPGAASMAIAPAISGPFFVIAALAARI